MKLTKEFLKKHQACKEGIDFAVNNNLLNKTINLKETTGDYRHFIDWLKNLPKREYDKNNNLIKHVTAYGDTFLYEYDQNNNKIKEVTPSGRTYTYSFTHSDNKFIITENNETICTVVFES